jgi:hypothetical protein
MAWGWLNPLEWGNTGNVDEDEKSYNDGADRAETLIAVDADVVPTQVEVMADQLSTNSYEFYSGFRDVWNSQPGFEPTGFWNSGFVRWIRGRE